MHTDKNGAPIVVGDRIMAPGYPQFTVAVMELVPCQEGCPNGAAAILDPETQERDEVCLGSMVKRV